MPKSFESPENKSLMESRTIIPIGKRKDSELSKSWLRTVGEFFGLIKKYTAEDLTRLKEAGVRLVESKAEMQQAEASEKLANAAEKHANAEYKKIQATIEMKKAEAEIMLNKAEAIERVVNAISKIKQEGGSVAFDLNQLNQILGIDEQ